MISIRRSTQLMTVWISCLGVTLAMGAASIAIAHQDQDHGETDSTTADTHTAQNEDDQADNEHDSGHGDADNGGHGAPDLGQQRAQALAVKSPPAWYSKVVWGIATLFVLAATLGSAAIVLKGPEPPDPADDHH